MAGRPRKPTKLLELSGELKRRPSRYKDRESEPKPKGQLGGAPEFLTENEKRAWDWIVSIVPDGVLSDADEPTLAGLAKMLATEFFGDGLSDTRARLMYSLLGKLGLNPADRAKLSVPTPKKSNRWAES